MSVADFPNRPHKPGDFDIDIKTWSRLAFKGAVDQSKLQNIFKPSDLHPPGIANVNGMAMDDMGDREASEWAWRQIGSAIGAGLTATTFLGFPALANLAQKAEYRRIVETLATEMTRKWIKLNASSEDDKTDKLKAINEELARLHVRDVFKKAAEHDGFFGRGHIYLDYGTDLSDDVELATPIGTGGDDVSRSKVAGKSIRALRVVEPVWIYPQDYTSTNPLDENFYRPSTWIVSNKRVHTSRLLTFVGRPVSDLLKPAYSFGGVPMTQLAMLYVENWQRIRDSVGTLIESFSILGLKTKLAEAANLGDGGANLARRIDIFNNLRRNDGCFVIDSEEEFFNINIPLSTLDQLQAQAQEHMAAVSGIPLVKLLGLSPHGLNASSEGEIRVFYDWVHATQEFFFRPHIKTLIDFIQLGLFGEVDPDIDFGFEPLWTSSELEQAQVLQTNANTDKAYIEAGVLSAKEVRAKVGQDKEMPYSGLDLDETPDLAPNELSENATKMATPILTAYTDGLITPSKALEELVEAGVFKTITQQDIMDADAMPPDPEMGPGGGGGGGGAPGAGGGGPPTPSGSGGGGGRTETGAPPLASTNDAAPKFDLGKLTKLESEEVLRALRDGDTARVIQILKERETYRGAWDDASAGFTVYHGTPYDLTEFDAEHIGTGTGREHYGRGLYFASDPKVAQWYKAELTDRVNLGGKPLHLNAAVTNIVGHIYRVEVHASTRDFADWDKPIDLQTPAIRSALTRVFGTTVIGQAIVDRRTLGDLLKANGPGATANMQAAGIHGIKYADTRVNGSTNYVVFDPEEVTIIDKDGGPLTQDAVPYDKNKHPKDNLGHFTHKGQGVGPKAPTAPAPPHHAVHYHGLDPRSREPAQLSWESAPGKTTKHMPQYHDAPIEQRREYQHAIEGVLADENGHDKIAAALGLRTGKTFSAAGVFKGRVNPGAQAQVDIGRIGDDDKAKINAGEAVRGMLLRQDAAAWHKPEIPAGHKYLIPGLKTPDGTVFPEDHGEALTHTDAFKGMSIEAQNAFLKTGRNDDRNYVFKNDKGQVLDRRKARQYAEKEGLLSKQAFNQPDLIAEHLDSKAATRFVDVDPAEANMVDFQIGRTPTEQEAQDLDRALSSVQGMDYALVPTPKGWRVLNTGDMPNDQFGSTVHQAIENLENTSLPTTIEATRAHYVGGYVGNDWSKSPNAEDYLQAIGQAGPDVQRSADTLLATLGPQIDAVEKQFSEKYGWAQDGHKPWSKGPAQDLLAANGGSPHEGQIGAATAAVLAKHGLEGSVADVRNKLAASVPSDANVKDGGFTQDDGTFTPERTAMHKDMLSKLYTPDMVQRATPLPGQKPTMTILGGRGGSGKSYITGDEGPVSRKNTVVIDSDHFKQQLPGYEGWNAALFHEESSHIADMAAQIAQQRGLNVAFDQTMRSGLAAPRRIEQFKGTHNINGVYMHATPEVAADRAMGRFKRGTTPEKSGRFVPPEYILGSHDNEKNFDAIIPHLRQWSVYDNNGAKGAPRKVAEGKNERNL